jgi:hypothetical protein
MADVYSDRMQIKMAGVGKMIGWTYRMRKDKDG